MVPDTPQYGIILKITTTFSQIFQNYISILNLYIYNNLFSSKSEINLKINILPLYVFLYGESSDTFPSLSGIVPDLTES